MRAGLMCVLAAAVLASCVPVSEGEFFQEFAANYCEEWDVCNPGGEACPLDFAIDGPVVDGPFGLEDWDCEFDRRAAKDCLQGTWTGCYELAPDVVYPIAPAVCEAVWESGWPFASSCWTPVFY